MEDFVLLSWADLRTDPYATGRDGTLDRESPGPTLTLLFDPESPYRGKVARAVLFYRKPNGGARPHEDFAAAEATRKEIERLSSRRRIEVEQVPGQGEDPTVYSGIVARADEQLDEVGT